MAYFAPHIKISQEMSVVAVNDTFAVAVMREMYLFLDEGHNTTQQTLDHVSELLARLVLEYEKRGELGHCECCGGRRFLHIGFDPPNRMLVVVPCETCTNLRQHPPPQETP